MKRKSIFIIVVAFLFLFAIKNACFVEGASLSSEYLCEYGIKLYKEGNIEEARHEFKKALLVNPRNKTASSYLEILSREQSGLAVITPKKTVEQRIEPSKIVVIPRKEPRKVEIPKTVVLRDDTLVQEKERKLAELNGKISELKQEYSICQEQLSSVKEDALAKEEGLKQLDEQLRAQRELYDQKELQQRLVIQDRELKAVSLEDKLRKLQEKSAYYQKQLSSLKDFSSERYEELSYMNEQLESEKSQYEDELQEKERELEDLRDEYDQSRKRTNSDIKQRELKIELLSSDKKLFLEEKKKAMGCKVDKIKGLMKEIEGIMTQINAPLYLPVCPSPSLSSSAEDKPLSRIAPPKKETVEIVTVDGLMKEIAEALPLYTIN